MAHVTGNKLIFNKTLQNGLLLYKITVSSQTLVSGTGVSAAFGRSLSIQLNVIYFRGDKYTVNVLWEYVPGYTTFQEVNFLVQDHGTFGSDTASC